MIRYSEGQGLQVRFRGKTEWIDHPRDQGPVWNWCDFEYRLVPIETYAWADVFGRIVRLWEGEDDIADHSSHRRVTLVVKEEKE